MKDNEVTAFLAGPSKNCKSNLWIFGSIEENRYKEYIHNLAETINKSFSKIGILPDYGVPLDVAKEIFNLIHRKTVIQGFYPKYGNLPRLKDNFCFCDELIEVDGGWATMNTQPSKNFDVMLCIGLSAGVFTEISHTKVHRIWSNKNIPIILDERTISAHLNLELEADVNVIYIRSFEDIINFAQQFKEGG